MASKKVAKKAAPKKVVAKKAPAKKAVPAKRATPAKKAAPAKKAPAKKATAKRAVVGAAPSLAAINVPANAAQLKTAGYQLTLLLDLPNMSSAQMNLLQDFLDGMGITTVSTEGDAAQSITDLAQQLGVPSVAFARGP